MSESVKLSPDCPIAFAFSEELLDDEVLGPDDTANSGQSVRPDVQRAVEQILRQWAVVHKRNCDRCRDYGG